MSKSDELINPGLMIHSQNELIHLSLTTGAKLPMQISIFDNKRDN